MDDKVVKSEEEENHVQILKKLFGRLSLRFDPVKGSFGLKSGKLLRFVVSDKGIKEDPKK